MSRIRTKHPWAKLVTSNMYNLNTFANQHVRFTGSYGIPVMEKCDFIPEALFPYDERQKWVSGDGAIQFFCEDKRFESVWLRLNRQPYMPEIILKVGSCTSPDFSLFTDHSPAVHIWNTYRSRLCGALWQSLGIDVIPTISWAENTSYDFCFDGLSIGGTVAIATNYINNPDEKVLFLNGYREMIKRVKPDMIICQGKGLKGQLEKFHPDVRRFETRAAQQTKKLRIEAKNVLLSA